MSYKYNRDIIIDRINSLKGRKRSAGYWSNEKIAEYFDRDITTVNRWLNPDETADIPISILMEMCNLFGCDIDYLLGRIPEKTKETTDICSYTGLSADAVKNLQRIKETIPEKLDRFSPLDGYYKSFHSLLNEIIKEYNPLKVSIHPNDAFPTRQIVHYLTAGSRIQTYLRYVYFLKYVEYKDKYLFKQEDEILNLMELDGCGLSEDERTRFKTWYDELKSFERDEKYDLFDISQSITSFLKGFNKREEE